MKTANHPNLGLTFLGVAMALFAHASATAASPDSGTNRAKCYQDSINLCKGKQGQAYTDCVQTGADICAAIYAGSEEEVKRKPLGLTSSGAASPVRPAAPGVPTTRAPVPPTTKN